MNLDQRLIDAAVDQMNRRWPAEEYGGAAAVYLEDGQILTSVCLDNLNAGVTLCHETGAICQAYTLNRRVTASVCVGREAGSSDVFVLAPCGICQERLALWGRRFRWELPIRAAHPDGRHGHFSRSTRSTGGSVCRRWPLALSGGPCILTRWLLSTPAHSIDHLGRRCHPRSDSSCSRTSSTSGQSSAPRWRRDHGSELRR